MMIWGFALLFQNIMQAAQQTAQTGATTPFNPNTFATFAALFYGGLALMALGGIAQLVARIGALMEMAKAQEWTWFVLTIIFDWFVILVYLIAVRPKPNLAPQYPAYPASPYATPVPAQPWSDYSPQAAGMVPPPAQPWPAYPSPQVSSATQPAEQPLPYPLQTPQQKEPDKPQE